MTLWARLREGLAGLSREVSGAASRVVVALLLWLFGAAVDLAYSIGQTALPRFLDGQAPAIGTLIGKGELLPGTGLLALVATGTLLAQPGQAPALLRLVTGAAAVMVAVVAAFILGYLQAHTSASPMVVTTMSEVLYGAASLVGLLCVGFSVWREQS